MGVARRRPAIGRRIAPASTVITPVHIRLLSPNHPPLQSTLPPTAWPYFSIRVHKLWLKVLALHVGLTAVHLWPLPWCSERHFLTLTVLHRHWSSDRSSLVFYVCRSSVELQRATDCCPMTAAMSACLFIYLSVRLSVRMSVCLCSNRCVLSSSGHPR